MTRDDVWVVLGFLVVMLLGGCGSAADCAVAAGDDVTGRWTGTLTMQQGPMDVEILLSQNPDATIIGTATLPNVVWSPSTSPFHPTAEIEGDLRGDRLTLAFAWLSTGALWTLDGLAAGDGIEGHIREATEYTLSITRGGP
ncbi:MAG TPA: hypothetical protein VMS92_22930 [Mycobacterium sp.]|nr:hypothetical protein [Mycobacterium sp.]